MTEGSEVRNGLAVASSGKNHGFKKGRMRTAEYAEFLNHKTQYSGDSGFKPVFMPDCMFDFQKRLTEENCRAGRFADLTDCGTGKSLLELVYAQNIVETTNGRVLLMTPNAVSAQTVAEGEKFGIECARSKGGNLAAAKIIVSNYEQLSHFDPNDFVAFVGDECSILKNAQGVTRNKVTEFIRHMRYRLMATATPAPNDFFELGTLSEALGYLGHMDMLNRFFKNDLNNSASGRMHGKIIEWRFKGHAEEPFYRYICSWARAARKPSDLGFDDMVDADGRKRPFVLPPLEEIEHIVESDNLREGMLFATPAFGMREQREERRVSLVERCRKVVELVQPHPSSICWYTLNPEGDLLARTVPDCVHVSGRDSDEEKEEKFAGFVAGHFKRLVINDKIGAFGLNFQHCAHQTGWPDHSFERYYQKVRRSLRFGQLAEKVTIDMVMTEGDRAVMNNMKRKANQAVEMFAKMIERMNEALGIERGQKFTQTEEVPAWLQ
jgi:hypothetical protein